MQADDAGKLAPDETAPHVKRSGTLRVEAEAQPPSHTRRVEAGPAPAPGTLRVEAEPPGTKRIATPAPDAAPARVRMLGEVEPGTLLFGAYTVVRTLQEHEHDQAGIFLATDAAGRDLIVKVHPRDYTPDPTVHGQLTGLRQANIIATYEYREQDGYAYEVQEHCGGGTLQQLVPEPGAPLTQERISWVFYDFLPQIHAGLSYLHEHNIVHRDIKPANLYIRREPGGDTYVLGDFDISSTLEQTRTSRLTQRTWLTLEYAAPEQFPQLSAQGGRLAARISRKSDYWSLGITLIELLIGTTTLHQIGPELVQDFYMKGRRVEVPDGLPENATLLLRGLLIRDDELRWGAAQVERWLKRQTTAEDQALLERDMTYAGYHALTPYRLQELVATNLRELGAAMARKPELALDDLMGGETLLSWVAQHDTNMARDLRRDRDRWRSTPEVALQCAIQQLDPRQPFRFADGVTAGSAEEWAVHAYALSQTPGRLQLDLGSLALHNQLAQWLKLKDPPEPELAQAVRDVAGHPSTVRAQELMFLLDPLRPLVLAPGLEVRTPDEFVKLAYGKAEDWRADIPPAYAAAFTAWRSGALGAWLRQRGNAELARRGDEAAKAFAEQPYGGFETALRLLDPRLAPVKVSFERRSFPRRLYVPYGDQRLIEARYSTDGPGVPFGALVQTPQLPGVNLSTHVIDKREGKLEVYFTAGMETRGATTYSGKLVLESGVAAMSGGALPLRFHVGFPHFVTLQRMGLGALCGALLLGFPRFVAWLMGLKQVYHFSQLNIGALWDDAINLRFVWLNLVFVALLAALAAYIGWRLWLMAVQEAEP